MSENVINRSVLTDGILALANYFGEHGFNPPMSVTVDRLAFEKILSESAELYNIDSKKAIAKRRFSISGIIVIKEQKKEKT
jgi:hypothetical protein